MSFRRPHSFELITASLLLAAASILAETRSTGIFRHPIGPATAVISGIDTDEIEWGTPFQASALPNRLSFTGKTFSLPINQRRSIGTLTYQNGISELGSVIDCIETELTLAGTDSLTAQFILEIDTTSNDSDAEASSDSLRLLTPYSSTPLIRDTKAYGIRLFFGEVQGATFAETEQVILLENALTEIPLEAVVCESLPIPSTTTAFQFGAITGGDDLLVEGENTPTIKTGRPSGNQGSATEYEVISQKLSDVGTEIPFVVGTMRFHNGTVTTGTAAEATTLRFDLSQGIGSLAFPLRFTSTPNSRDAKASADIVELLDSSSSEIKFAGLPHVARLHFANPSPGGFTKVSTFSVQEGVTAEANLVLVISRFIAETPPLKLSISSIESSNILLSWPSIIGLTYQLESSKDMITFDPNGDSVEASNTATLIQRPRTLGSVFFRLRVDP